MPTSAAAARADIEVLLTDHISDMSTPVTRAMHAGVLRFGHCAVRYTTSDGKQRVMNILGGRQLSQPNASMVNFCDPCEYLYGTAGFDTFAQQGGAYNRPIVGVRIERVADGAMDAMHAYFLALDAKSKVGNGLPGLATPGSDSRGAARFQLVEVRLSSIMRQVPEPISRVLGNVLEFLKRAQSKPDPAVPLADAEHGGAKAVRMVSEMAGDLDAVRASSFTAGNCAQWTSSGLEFAGLIRRSRLFPKSILIEVRGVEAISVDSDGVSFELDALPPPPSFPSVARVRALEAAVQRARGVLRPGGARHPTRPPVAAREARVRPPALPRQEPPLRRHAQVCRRGGEAGPLPACGMWEAVGVCIMGGHGGARPAGNATTCHSR